MFRFYNILAGLFLVLVVVINLAHPFLHAFEGGSLDMILVYMNSMAMNFSNKFN